MDSKAFDEHGHIDVIEEPWLDLSFEPGSPQITINGASLQTLLKGMFILHSNYRSNDVLPGGITPWREAAPVVFTTLFHIASISQMMSRVYLVMDKHTKMNEDPSYGLHLDRTEVEATAQGALTFISFMVSHFRSHIKDLHMLEIRDSVENLADLCQSGEEVKELHARLLTDINALTTRFTLLNEFGPAKARDEMLMPRIEHYRHFGSERLEDVTHDSEIRDIFGGAAAGKGDGVWDSDSDEGTGSAIRDPRPEIDMENGISLTDRVVPSLSEHMGRFMIIVNTFSVLEIARQWTLMDHRLFCKIKLPTLLHTDDRGDIECHWEVPRYIQGARGVRGFVDQFDTEVRWVYSAVLDPHRDGSQTTSDERAGVIEWLIELASELLRLNNFSGLMATISGLDQPGVRRLDDTWSHVSTEAKRKLNEMREIMAPKNNYSMYVVVMIYLPLSSPAPLLTHFLCCHSSGIAKKSRGDSRGSTLDRVLNCTTAISITTFKLTVRPSEQADGTVIVSCCRTIKDQRGMVQVQLCLTSLRISPI